MPSERSEQNTSSENHNKSDDFGTFLSNMLNIFKLYENRIFQNAVDKKLLESIYKSMEYALDANDDRRNEPVTDYSDKFTLICNHCGEAFPLRNGNPQYSYDLHATSQEHTEFVESLNNNDSDTSSHNEIEDPPVSPHEQLFIYARCNLCNDRITYGDMNYEEAKSKLKHFECKSHRRNENLFHDSEQYVEEGLLVDNIDVGNVTLDSKDDYCTENQAEHQLQPIPLPSKRINVELANVCSVKKESPDVVSAEKPYAGGDRTTSLVTDQTSISTQNDSTDWSTYSETLKKKHKLQPIPLPSKRINVELAKVCSVKKKNPDVVSAKKPGAGGDRTTSLVTDQIPILTPNDSTDWSTYSETLKKIYDHFPGEVMPCPAIGCFTFYHKWKKLLKHVLSFHNSSKRGRMLPVVSVKHIIYRDKTPYCEICYLKLTSSRKFITHVKCRKHYLNFLRKMRGRKRCVNTPTNSKSKKAKKVTAKK